MGEVPGAGPSISTSPAGSLQGQALLVPAALFAV
jgi:hypothetical protein